METGPKKFKTEKSSSKILATVFWDRDEILQPSRQSTTLHFSTNSNSNWSPNVEGKLSKGILFLQDNVASHKTAITCQKLTDLHSEVLKHHLLI
jgi:hypothetical protein